MAHGCALTGYSRRAMNAADFMQKESAVSVTYPAAIWQRDRYVAHDLTDEVRVDQLCGELLRVFRDDLLARGTPPLEAGELARGADYFLRDFVLDDRRRTPFDVGPREVRQFAGNWYIVRTVEPKLEELVALLRGVAVFYAFAARNGVLSEDRAAQIAAACAEHAFYASRIEAFWAIRGDGYDLWERACSLKD